MEVGETPGWKDYLPKLNDKWLPDCVVADEENGVAICFKRDGKGQLMHGNGYMIKEILKGKIELIKTTPELEREFFDELKQFKGGI